jgi:hypothetical protein
MFSKPSVRGALRVIAALASAACLLVACASSPLPRSGAPPDNRAATASKNGAIPPEKNNAPEWVANFNSIFPQDKYISGKGYGASREAAEPQ